MIQQDDQIRITKYQLLTSRAATLRGMPASTLLSISLALTKFINLWWNGQEEKQKISRYEGSLNKQLQKKIILE
jgi:hypothetical protein